MIFLLDCVYGYGYGYGIGLNEYELKWEIDGEWKIIIWGWGMNMF